MQINPLLGFLWRRSGQIQNLLTSGMSDDKTSHLVIDILVTNEKLLKQVFPPLSEKAGQEKALLDDIIDTLREVLLPLPPPQS